MTKSNDIASFPPRVNADRKFKKQISLFVSLKDFVSIRKESINRNISMTALLYEWIKPDLRKAQEK